MNHKEIKNPCTLSFVLISLRKGDRTSVIIGDKGNGTPLQYSCLENPMDGGTW